ncbi:hypothetical protein V9T40_006100 [Parthenolecanium corni]|uniref:Uncharacterized protein n=1 Tax=Parthenolecanium corni TaxID=536013 RepID=A0AAN9TTB1_9HEMI
MVEVPKKKKQRLKYSCPVVVLVDLKYGYRERNILFGNVVSLL